MRQKAVRLHDIRIRVMVLALIATCVVPAPAATEKILHRFSQYPNGAGPNGLVSDSKGNFYGAAGGGLYGAGIVYRLTPDSNGDVTETVLYNFTGAVDGFNPLGVVLVQDNVYGFTYQGGTANYGTFFELTPSVQGEWNEKVLYNFADYEDQPLSGPSVDKLGNFFGVVLGTGSCCGADNIFELTRSQGGVWTYNVIYSFSSGYDGAYCNGGFAFDQSNNLYGTCRDGGSNQFGVVYELFPSSGGTWSETVLYNFTGTAGNMGPNGGLIFDAAGNLFGSANGGGVAFGCGPSGSCGLVYELSPQPDGTWSEASLYSFGTDNNLFLSVAPSPLTFDDAGNLFGTTLDDGSGFCNLVEGCGMIFELSPNGSGQWTASTLYNFTSTSGDGYTPLAGVIRGSSGRFYGTTSFGGLGSRPGTVFELKQESSGQWITRIVYGFPTTDGYGSQATLIQDAAGNLYGTTRNGGIYNGGTVFELSPASGAGWTEQILYTFHPKTFPYGNLVMDSTGNLYGTAELGTIFELLPATGGTWKEKVIYSIPNQPHGLVFDTAGNLYGTTMTGGAYNWGSIFELTPGANGRWTETVIYSFKGLPSDGATPRSGVIFDAAGNLYGTTSQGGLDYCNPMRIPAEGCGTVYELSPTQGGWSETLLYLFKNSSDGAFPYSGVVFDASGNLYGTTYQGGTGSCRFPAALLGTCGTVFELSPDGGGHWTETVLHSFTGLTKTTTDGALPGGVVLDVAGNLYGSTELGGAYQDLYDTDGIGTVFKLSPSSSGAWTETILYNFGPEPDGGHPQASLLVDSAGSLYGTTLGYPNSTASIVFEIMP